MAETRWAVTPRSRLVTDDSCHWYCIPSELRGKFDEWVRSYQSWEDEELITYDGPDFNEYRLNSHITNYTFLDLREDQ